MERVNDSFQGMLNRRSGFDRKTAITRILSVAGLTEDEVRASRAYFPRFPPPTTRATSGDIVTEATPASIAPVVTGGISEEEEKGAEPSI